MLPALDLGSGFGSASYALAAIAFALLSAHFYVSWRRSGPGLWLLLACIGTALCFGVSAFYYATGLGFNTLSPLNLLRSGLWIAFLVRLLVSHWQSNGRIHLAKVAPILFGAVFAILFAVDIYQALSDYITIPFRDRTYSIARGLAVALLGLALVENVYYATHTSSRWSIKFLCIALGGLFAYDIVVYADSLFLARFDVSLYQTRGVVSALIVPLLAVSAARNPAWSLDVFFSRRLAFRAFAITGAVIYLVIVATTGYFIGAGGGEWNRIVQTVFVFSAAILLLMIWVSGRLRSRLAIFLSKHFFNYKYDYREEWLRFIDTVSQSEAHADLRVRVIKGAADIVDSPSGVLYLRQIDNGFALGARWNFHEDAPEVEPADSPLIRVLESRNWIVNLKEAGEGREVYGRGAAPDWLNAIEDAWLALPLILHQRLMGFIVLTTPRAPRQLNFEDFDILKTVCSQSASYLAEQQLQIALSEARRFEEFNRRFAFVMHDIKNLVSQLSLLVTNAEKHGANPKFRNDMVLTVRGSVAKLNRLLNRLHGEGEKQYPPEPIALEPLIRRIAEEKCGENLDLTIECQSPGIAVSAHRDRLGWVFRHLVQNAVDVLPEHGRIAIRLHAEDDFATVEIKDEGPGMTQEFIANELFQPFRTTKEHGYGLGAYEAREIVRELGGRLEVESATGKGTTMIVRLPTLREAPVAAEREAG